VKILPTLYKKTSTGATQMWSIGVDTNTIIVNFGQIDGKIQRTEEVIKNGKNVGRVNATTPEEQALAEATAKWEGKIKKGYVEDVARAEAGEKDIDGGYDCMLAHKFADHGHKIKYPAYTQPKLNGHRCLAIIDNGVAKLYSRTRKPITSCPHIIEELQKIYLIGYHEIDGELYNHSYRDNFEELASLIRQETPAANCTEVQYHVYDKPSKDGFNKRTDTLYGNIHGYEMLNGMCKYIIFTETVSVKNEDVMINAFESFLKRGYEGGMARNSDGEYQGKRSYNLQKIKEFQDADYPIVGIEEGRGGYAGCGIFLCKNLVGDTFSAKMRGPKEQLALFLNNPKLWTNKTLVVKYQYISKYGIPIFPIGERFKEEL
jgi:DNA ligase-1